VVLLYDLHRVVALNSLVGPHLVVMPGAEAEAGIMVVAVVLVNIMFTGAVVADQAGLGATEHQFCQGHHMAV
jgi:hypothetical protein